MPQLLLTLIMNIFQKALGAIFPPYRFSVIRREQSLLFTSIISALPDDYSALKAQTLSGRFFGLDQWALFPEFKFVSIGYSGDRIFQYKKRGQNFKISGLEIFSRQNNRYENVEILIQDNLIVGLRITNSGYQRDEFDLLKLRGDKVFKNDFVFPPSAIDIFYNGLAPEITQKLAPDSLSEIDLHNRIYYAFHDLDDGNYLAVDRNSNVYSLVHDAIPVAKRMKHSFMEILDDLQSNKFDKEKHLAERYGKGK